MKLFEAVFILISLTLSIHAQVMEGKKPYALNMNILKGGDSPFSGLVPDGKGDFAIGRANGEVGLYNHDGNFKNKIITMKSFSQTFFFKNGDFALSEHGNLYFLYNSRTQQTRVQAETYINHNARVLKNDLLAFPETKVLKFYNSKGDIKHELKIDNPWSITEDSKGNLAIYNYKQLLFLNSDLSVKSQITGTGTPAAFTTDGTLLIPIFNKGIDLVDQDGKIKGQFKIEETISTIVPLSNGNAALMCLDGYIYFIDSTGKKIGFHFHDSDAVWDLITVNDNVLAYTNKTQLVFIDLAGKELGNLDIPTLAKRSSRQLTRIDDNHLSFTTNSDYHIIKMRFR